MCRVSQKHDAQRWAFMWLGNFLTVRPADEHINKTKFLCNDKTSQQTNSVATSAGWLEIYQAKN